jgi:hypothetical protein
LTLLVPLKSQDFEVVAVAGEPFGVGAITYQTSFFEGKKLGAQHPSEVEAFGRNNMSAPSLSWFEFISAQTLQEENDRVLYPVTHSDSNGLVLYFLFMGAEELKLELSSPLPFNIDATIRVKPSTDAELQKRMLQEWWAAYLGRIEIIKALDAYAPATEMGIAAIMQRRLGFLGSLPYDVFSDGTFENTLGLLLGAESIRLAMQVKTLLDTKDDTGTADQPLPEPATVPEMPVPPFNDSLVQVEPIAMRVPAECFYVRFGSFSDFLASRDFLDQWGSVFRSMFSSRSLDLGMMKRLERQLALKETLLSKHFGSMVIQDVAVVGTDPFIREGASIGVLLHARQNSLLKGCLESMRGDALRSDPNVAETAIDINGYQVSLLYLPGNSIRSFYVQDGDFHLVTNSRWIVENFLKTGLAPESGLGALQEFRYARGQVNATENGIFVYMSDTFFRNIIGPKYRIEMTRRADSVAEMQVMALARMMAEREGIECTCIDSLVASKFLPKGFGARPDSSVLIMENGRIADSLRGSMGSLLPIADVNIEGATKAEVEGYEAFSADYQRIWTNMDPVFGNLKTTKSKDGEKLELTLCISPYAKSKYDSFLRFLGQPLKDQIALVPGTLFSAEIRLNEDLLNEFNDNIDSDDDAPMIIDTKSIDLEKPYAMRFFAGLRDTKTPYIIREGSLIRDKELWQYLAEAIKGYVGYVIPKGHNFPLDLFLPQTTKSDRNGYYKVDKDFGISDKTKHENHLWVRKFAPFVMVGTDRALLETVSPNIKTERAKQPALIRVALGEFNKTGIGESLMAELYVRERQISVGGALQLQAIQQQLHPKDMDLALGELQDQKIVCPLGGKYVQDAKHIWKSTAWQEPALSYVNHVPKGYVHTILSNMKWLRLDFAIDPNTLNTRLEILDVGGSDEN